MEHIASAVLVKKIAHAILMGAAIVLISVAAWHFAGWWGVVLVQGLVLRGKL